MSKQAVYVEDNQLKQTIHQATFEFHGVQDAHSSLQLVKQVETACNAGVHNIIIDMSDTHLLKPNGLKALVNINSFLKEKANASYLGRKRKKSFTFSQAQIKLLNPSPAVRQLLDSSGLTGFVDVYGDI